MSNIIDTEQIASICFGKVDVDMLTSAINAATLSDVSNLGLNADESIAYENIMSSRKVEKNLTGTSVALGVNYDSVSDPGGYLDVLTGGQAAPEITGTVHLPQGGTRESNVKFWYPGQVYEEGAKDPVLFPENDQAILKMYGPDEVRSAVSQSRSEITAISAAGIKQYLTGR